MDPSTDPESLRLLADSVRTTMTAHSGAKLDAALTDLGWLDMLDGMPDTAIPLVFRLLGETGAHAPVLNDVVLRAAGAAPGGTLPLPFAGGSWVAWERSDGASSALDGELTQGAASSVIASSGVLAMLPLVSVLGAFWGRRKDRIAKTYAKDRAEVGRVGQEPLEMIAAVRASGQEAQESARYRAAIGRCWSGGM